MQLISGHIYSSPFTYLLTTCHLTCVCAPHTIHTTLNIHSHSLCAGLGLASLYVPCVWVYSSKRFIVSKYMNYLLSISNPPSVSKQTPWCCALHTHSKPTTRNNRSVFFGNTYYIFAHFLLTIDIGFFSKFRFMNRLCMSVMKKLKLDLWPI